MIKAFLENILSINLTKCSPASRTIRHPEMTDMESAVKSITSPCLEGKNQSWKSSVIPANIRPEMRVTVMACLRNSCERDVYLHVSHAMKG